MNKRWHSKNPMPSKPTLAQRCKWHEGHAKACACRPIPLSIAKLIGGGDRTLGDLDGVGAATLRDFKRLGIQTVEDLAEADPEKLYDRLCSMTGLKQDPCVLDVFSCAVAQARNPQLPKAQCAWWYWSRKRKAETSKR